ncbi:enoyl-CoA hydratase/isomerase family protein [Spongiibacter taiwanensis]|uniref:enoyl-CoA hydratase/isomerase family protein n=1 Tax=Spongiibacter taiwanensis TaxID=1748242 RepID=UPI002035BC0D|nr:enoyl-CoA hydratase/isomerase family protein [Spongiibacter taiwanensis]USA44566.1 enoyl-CoA hydratase/isomerase family protein [Spongiibacter taiwanensis]
MSDQAIDYAVDSRGVATITLTRPEIHNAFDDVVVGALSEAFKKAGEDPAVRAVILASTGKSFCAGGDLNWMKRMAKYGYEENLRDSTILAEMLRRLNTLPKLTIARVQGPAFGGGVGLVSCCDMAIAAPQAAFCLSEVKVGMIPATISPYVINAIGERASRRYFTTAELITAEKAHTLGLVSELVEADQLDDTIDGILKGLLRNGPRGVGEAKRLVLDYANQEITPDLIADSSKRIAETRGSDEGQEGLTAFLEKRKPNWIQ